MPFLATYRLQLHKGFKFQEAAQWVEYFHELGISHLYLSPIFESVPGSTHGYDGLNPQKISSERGGEQGFIDLLQAAQKEGLQGVILDIVPNHLAADWRNPAWWDVLLRGPKSKYLRVFDIKSFRLEKEPIVLPVLGKRREAALASRELILAFYNGDFVFKYFDVYFPIRASSRKKILKVLSQHLGRQWRTLKDLHNWTQAAEENKVVLEKTFSRLSLKFMNEILTEQFYVLKDWRRGSQEINYRRFFDVSQLIGVRIEDEKVYKWFHQKIFQLLKNYPSIQGLRIDHIDGLMFPTQYLQRLRKSCRHVWVEKILGDGESLPAHWPVMGSTGYEFSNISARLFVDLKGLLHLHAHYLREVDDRWERFHDCVYESKREMLDSHFVSEMNYLTQKLYTISQKSRKYKNQFTQNELAEAIAEVTASLRVYRTYAVRAEKISSHWLTEALFEAEGRGHISNRRAFDWFRQILTLPGNWPEDLYVGIKRWEQLTGPVMAKGLEDTALYRYCPLLSLNGVGGEPDWIGDGSREYHSIQQENLRRFPWTLTTTSTHDTKSSEDVRARIHVLAELSEEWIGLYGILSKDLHISDAPSLRVIYFIFETLIGAWPWDDKIDGEFVTRMQNYFTKALREAKTETSWSDVNEVYETKLKNFVSELLLPTTPEGRKFLNRLKQFTNTVSYFGAFNSLATVALKGTSPGVADFYQGCEMWDLSLVDPDNRRPIDYQLRRNTLANIKKNLAAPSSEEYLRRVRNQWQSGEIKLLLTHKVLQLRKAHPDLILKGEYLPVEPEGEKRGHFVSYIRHHKDQWVWIVLPRFLARTDTKLGPLELRDEKILQTKFILPKQCPPQWRHLISEDVLVGDVHEAKDLFKYFPIAILTATTKEGD